jgi:DNA-binding transcriptional LysR family regulator
MNLTLRQLKIFNAVSRHLSFTRAADELHLTQPAVSMQVKQLEQEVGLPLFEHQGKKIYLTEAGEEMHRYALSIMAQVDEAAQVFEEMKGLKRGRLNIAVASTANYFAPRLLGDFCERYPDVRVSLNVTNRKGLLRALTDNQADLVVMGRPPPDMDLVAESFMDNPLVMIASPNHPLCQLNNIPLQDLAAETFLVRERGSGTRTAMENHFAEHGVRLSTPMEMSTSEAIKQGVEAGLGLGILSLHTLEMELALKRVAILKVETFPIMRHWYVVHRKGKRLSQVTQAFKDFVLEQGESLASLPSWSARRQASADHQG